MNFKPDWSFLEKVSMGAVSADAVIDMLNEAGHDVIELERYSTSNKIWSTKIKRLRLPDLICIKCGKRIESRAKSKVAIKMSDNEKNPMRHWDAGLRDEDLIAFIACKKEDGEWKPGKDVNLFETASLRESVKWSKLDNVKSASEGSERTRTWLSTVPKKDGKVVEVSENAERYHIYVEYDDGGRSKRPFSVSKENGHVYCKKETDFMRIKRYLQEYQKKAKT